VIVRLMLRAHPVSDGTESGPGEVDQFPVEFRGFDVSLCAPLRPWRGLSASLVAHWACIALLIFLADRYRMERKELERIQVASYESLALRIPDEFLIAAPRPRPGGGSSAARAGGSRGPGGSKREPGRPAAAAAPSRNFELPPLPKKPGAQQTLLQMPTPPAELAGDLRLPNLQLWSAELPKLPPRPAPRKFVMRCV